MSDTTSIDYSTSSSASAGATAGGLLIDLVVYVLVAVAMWKVFTKAGKPGWAALIPIYNVYVLTQIVGRPGWWTLLFFIPLVNIVIALFIAIDLAKSFGKSTTFGVVGLWLFSIIGYFIVGFGSATYVGPAAASATTDPGTPAAPTPTTPAV